MDGAKVLAVGRGAVGVTLFHGLVNDPYVSEFAFLVDPARKARYEKTPFEVNGKPVTFRYVDSEKEFGKADIILIACKFPEFETVMDEIAPFIEPGTILVSCLNGICTEDMLRKRFPEALTIRAIAQNMDAVHFGDSVNYHSQGELVLGMDQTHTERPLAALVQVLEAGHVPVVLSKNIVRDQWKKLMANCAVNQICAAYDLTYGQMLSDPRYRQMFLDTMEEVMKVANAKGIDLNRDDIAYWLNSAMKWNPDSMPSMEQDMKAGRKSELTLFSGTVVPMADALSIEVPLLKDLEKRIEARQADFKN